MPITRPPDYPAIDRDGFLIDDVDDVTLHHESCPCASCTLPLEDDLVDDLRLRRAG